MKQEQSRVLAYRLAKEINHAELEDISGGATGFTQKWTAYPTGETRSPDGQMDFTIDW